MAGLIVNRISVVSSPSSIPSDLARFIYILDRGGSATGTAGKVTVSIPSSSLTATGVLATLSPS